MCATVNKKRTIACARLKTIRLGRVESCIFALDIDNLMGQDLEGSHTHTHTHTHAICVSVVWRGWKGCGLVYAILLLLLNGKLLGKEYKSFLCGRNVEDSEREKKEKSGLLLLYIHIYTYICIDLYLYCTSFI